ncbi:efflux RND transporter periplasmic adaptor subunit [Ruminococcus sp. AF37-6AT]|nr:efflux RND transporter periplasmic adaptor subunit [Ruminococcus sp. AM07-21]RHL47582.1 efflux RND transporter periplasmic adaptor subunit [Ruminococcus sp. AF37-6AT]RHP55929.1 efflux RND transporter periplasmic adaptor subunit [Ruminococcus sp. AF31-16BH]
MKKRIIIVLGILIAVGGIGSGVWYHFNGSGQSGSGDTVVYVSKVSVITGAETAATNRFAGVVEPQETVNVKIESGRKVKEVQVKTGEEVKKGQLLFEYDLSSIEDDLKQAQLDLDRLKNEQISLTEQISTLEAEKKKAKAEDQLSYTIEIETNKMNLKKNEYSQKSKQSEIDKLQSATQNTEVRSEIDGVIQKIDTSKMTSDDGDSVDDSSAMDSTSSSDSSSDSSAFITILSTGAYRVKGKVNEQNRDSIVPGEAVIIRSRVDSSKTWKGTMGSIDVNNGTSDDSSNDMYFGMSSTSSDDQTTSTSYPFYVELDSSENLMLGQHVYIERDIGQDDQKDGLWLSDYYILDTDTNEPYVWAANDKNRLEKRYVTLGKHDDDLGEYEIVDGLTKKDAIAFPTEALEEGEKTEVGDLAQTMSGGADGITDMESSADDFTEPDMDESPTDTTDNSSDTDDVIDPNEELVPIDEAPGMSADGDVEGIE